MVQPLGLQDIKPAAWYPPLSSRPSSTRLQGNWQCGKVARVFGAPAAFMMTVTGASSDTLCRMPEISRFLGIAIRMYHREHGVPHFHAVYAEHGMSVEVESAMVHGTFPKRALRHVLEWAALHEAELLANWELARQGKPIRHIAPLE